MAAGANNSARDHDLAVTSSKLLFERRNRTYTICLIGLVALFVVVPLVNLFSDDPPLGRRVGIGRGIAVIYSPIFAVAMLVLLLRTGFAALRCYERGVCYSTLFRKRCYLYEELAAFTFGPQRTDDGQVVDSDDIEFVLEPHGAKRRDWVTFSDHVKANPTGMRLLRNAVARAMAPSLAERVASGGRLSWTSLLCFEGDRVIFDFSQTPERSISVRDLEFIDFTTDTALIYIAGMRDPLMQLDMRVRNFYPGLFCLELLRQRYGAPPVFIVENDGEIFPTA